MLVEHSSVQVFASLTICLLSLPADGHAGMPRWIANGHIAARCHASLLQMRCSRMVMCRGGLSGDVRKLDLLLGVSGRRVVPVCELL
jgi:hypothetical protein